MLVSKWQILAILWLLLSLGCGDDSNHDGDSHAHGGDDTGMGGDDTGMGGDDTGMGGDDTGMGGGDPGCTPGDADELTVDYYAFDAKYDGEGDSTSYSGQTARHALISGLKKYIDGLGGVLAANSSAAATVRDELNLLYTCSSVDANGTPIGDLCDGDHHQISTDLPATQTTIGDISGGKSLSGKIAGKDATGQSTDWETVGLKGWGTDAEVITPDGLVNLWLDMIGDNALAIADGNFVLTPDGEEITKPSVTAEGHDLAQLVQKFLLGAVAFSQAADDYLDYDEADFAGTDLVASGKGLFGDNTALKSGKNYTPLEHTWDEGFGYFGAAKDYLAYTDDEIARKDGREEYQGHHDTNNDCRIDLTSEFNWGHSVNAAKRDRNHTTDLTADAFNAFYAGRLLITETVDALTEAQMTELKAHSDNAIAAWEKAIAATVIHYINDTIADMDASDADYDFYTHAKHWSEMKGFALSFQFNRRSPMSAEAFAALHVAFGDAPVLRGAENFEAYKTGLLDTRTTLGTIYGFDATDVETW